ncbi:cytochrome b/b6 domain-containing protein [Nocardioides sp. TF02-7]|uniref:cytochrome b n=1 Tax=Nocardioides sp. TF02-7 TaxID=2917724 RepID=UPI001F051F42|nr:cytochrome b/b6 domain-containing protein [Nocardioides sp. TF02-7]UMG92387.1 cytochrome b/b6 domain-containing protein [Nocardioides sp. TF02-7]
MRLRNGEHGYGVVTKTLHWLTVLVLAGQLVVGYTMATERDGPDVDCDPPGERSSGGDTSDAEEERLDRMEERCEADVDRVEEEYDDLVGAAWDGLWSGGLADGGLGLAEAHVLLGLLVLALGVARVLWRRTTPLPPWDPRLTTRDQRIVHATEVALLALLFAIPLSGLLLVVGADDLVAVHVATHVAFFVALAAHLSMVLGRRLLPRMLPWGGPPRVSGR